ncbi:amino acid ABC transporter permease [Mesorhizobium tamadayense]|uniref:Amino acid ABC transporter permease n=1 Tax=Mesorhizobium tamadayense TaxID=425306 RepID=A0A3P3EP98_9HYPH|nr:amino acid ABC transporter permease [Mesorhizobium tamadayense]RRH88233.1 amino acid ABC transporter permease [Mesorhizobium tamadayense]
MSDLAISAVVRQRPTIAKWMGALFNPWPHALVTILAAAVVSYGAVELVRWAVIDATFRAATPDDCRAAGGACWSMLRARYNIILFGSYPPEEYWRPTATVLLVLGLLVASGFRTLWKPWLAFAWVATMIGSAVLMSGGLPGLPDVPTSKWGGLPLTVGLSAFGIILALPLSVLIALGRRSQVGVVKRFCDAYVEIVRGLPLLAVLFVASTLLPLLLPFGGNVDTVLRAQIALVLFQAAYLAEAIRSGLEAVPRGQSEAAASLGLPDGLVSRLVVLPQAFRIALPAIINTFIESIKDTTLISVIGLVDVLGGARGAIADGVWMGFYGEAYLAVGAAFFAFCFILSLHSRRLEEDFARERR